jgi:hypothetical protein
MVQAPHNGLLYEIVCLIHLARERDGEGPQVWDSFEQAGTEFIRQR